MQVYIRQYVIFVGMCPGVKCVIVPTSHTVQGVVTSVASLLLTLANHSPAEYKAAQHVAINRLHRVLVGSADDAYLYYHVRAPWLVVKLLRLLQAFPFPGALRCRFASVSLKIGQSLLSWPFP
jgi:hypothetical protein